MSSPHPAQQEGIRGVCLMRKYGHRNAPLCSWYHRWFSRDKSAG
ncbi:hypothetical protein HRbin10_01984 [bacterium HR10]|nr:hypothetical protein HRbin10_01984 [bacterium HR10]